MFSYGRVCVCVLSYALLLVMLWTKPTRLLCPWDFPARVLEWVAMPFSRASSQTRDQTQVSCTAGGFFTSGATRAAQFIHRPLGKSETHTVNSAREVS